MQSYLEQPNLDQEAALQKHRQEEIPLLNDRNDQIKVVRAATTRPMGEQIGTGFRVQAHSWVLP
ncbi:hypothetical protein [Armatimonas sp.]|uniref:hypothetical protein n=1 Tax=Armatimonas sp. TaxID=1872638 RepID=UPI00374D81A3